MTVDADTTERIKQVLADIPPQQWREGGSVQWGPEGNKARAIHLAARLGHSFDPHCLSCESDLWLVLINAVR